VLQFSEVCEGIEVVQVLVIPPVKLQEVDRLDTHAAQRPPDRLLNDGSSNPAWLGYPFGEGLDFCQGRFAASLPHPSPELADEVLRRPVVIGQVPSRE